MATHFRRVRSTPHPPWLVRGRVVLRDCSALHSLRSGVVASLDICDSRTGAPRSLGHGRPPRSDRTSTGRALEWRGRTPDGAMVRCRMATCSKRRIQPQGARPPFLWYRLQRRPFVNRMAGALRGHFCVGIVPHQPRLESPCGPFHWCLNLAAGPRCLELECAVWPRRI